MRSEKWPSLLLPLSFSRSQGGSGVGILPCLYAAGSRITWNTQAAFVRVAYVDYTVLVHIEHCVLVTYRMMVN